MRSCSAGSTVWPIPVRRFRAWRRADQTAHWLVIEKPNRGPRLQPKNLRQLVDASERNAASLLSSMSREARDVRRASSRLGAILPRLLASASRQCDRISHLFPSSVTDSAQHPAFNARPTDSSSSILVMFKPQKQPTPRRVRDVKAPAVKQPSPQMHSRCVGQVVQHCFQFFSAPHSAASKQTQN